MQFRETNFQVVRLRASGLQLFTVDTFERMQQRPKRPGRRITDTLPVKRHQVAYEIILLQIFEYRFLQFQLGNIGKRLLAQLMQPDNSALCENCRVCGTVLREFLILPVHRKDDFQVAFNSFKKTLVK